VARPVDGGYPVSVDNTSADLEHLRLLSIFHYILAGLAALFGCFPVLHLTIGLMIVQGALDRPGHENPPTAFGWLFVGIAGMMILFGWTLAVLLFVAGRQLSRHRGYTLCLVVAAIACLFIPLGTVLGVFTIIVLVRPSVKRLFGRETEEPGLV
jgi:hypothetical protein